MSKSERKVAGSIALVYMGARLNATEKLLHLYHPVGYDTTAATANEIGDHDKGVRAWGKPLNPGATVGEVREYDYPETDASIYPTGSRFLGMYGNLEARERWALLNRASLNTSRGLKKGKAAAKEDLGRSIKPLRESYFMLGPDARLVFLADVIERITRRVL